MEVEQRKCKRCGKIEDTNDCIDDMGPKNKILSNGYCDRCDKVIYDKRNTLEEGLNYITYPTYPVYPWYQINIPNKDNQFVWKVICNDREN